MSESAPDAETHPEDAEAEERLHELMQADVDNQFRDWITRGHRIGNGAA